MEIDFHRVDPQHAAIHGRLINGARWVPPRFGARPSPMFRGYRSTDQWIAPEVREAVDTLDAQRLEKAVSALPARYRMAIRWCYIDQTHPRRACRALAVSADGLMDLIRAARQMLLNRGACPVIHSRPFVSADA